VAPDRTYTSTLTLKKDGESTVGELVMDNGARTPLKDISVQGSAVKFATDLPIGNDQPLHLAFTGNGSGGEIKGQVTAGSFGTLPFTAKRNKAASFSLDGEWTLSTVTPNRTFTSTVVFKKDGDKLVGESISNSGNHAPLKDVSVDGNTVKFTREISFGNGDPVSLTFTGTADGDQIKGNTASTRGTSVTTLQRKSAPKTEAPSASGDLTGDWDFAIVAPDQTYRPTVHIEQKGDQLTGGMVGLTQEGDALPFTDGSIKEGAIHFVFTLPINGNNVRFDYNGKRDGDKLAGEVKSDLGTIPWSATRKASAK
jgi:hypothetical protein